MLDKHRIRNLVAASLRLVVCLAVVVAVIPLFFLVMWGVLCLFSFWPPFAGNAFATLFYLVCMFFALSRFMLVFSDKTIRRNGIASVLAFWQLSIIPTTMVLWLAALTTSFYMPNSTQPISSWAVALFYFDNVAAGVLFDIPEVYGLKMSPLEYRGAGAATLVLAIRVCALASMAELAIAIFRKGPIAIARETKEAFHLIEAT